MNQKPATLIATTLPFNAPPSTPPAGNILQELLSQNKSLYLAPNAQSLLSTLTPPLLLVFPRSRVSIIVLELRLFAPKSTPSSRRYAQRDEDG